MTTLPANTAAALCTDDPAVFAAALTLTRLDTVWTDDPRLDDGPALPVRIRGAWGWHLARAAADNAEAAAARQAFFPDKSSAPGFGGATPPYRIAVRRSGGHLHVTLALIGFAGRWRAIAFDMFVNALTAPPGLALDYRSGTPARLRLLDARWTRSEGVPLPMPFIKIALDFATPLRIGPKGVLGTSFDNIIVGLAERAAQTGSWIGLDFKPCLSQWRDVARTLRFDTSGLKPVVWDTFSTVNGHARAAGYLGRLAIASPSAPVLALLAVGLVLHAGSSPAKGCGRYTLAPAV